MDIDLKHINYIKFSLTDIDNMQHKIKAIVKFAGDLELHAQTKQANLYEANTPQHVTLNLICSNGLYTTDTELKYFNRNGEFINFVFTTPKEFIYKQDRGYFRVKLKKDAILSFKTENDIKRVPAKINDLSASGVKVDLKIAIDIPENVAINMLFDQKEVKTNAKFIRIETHDNIISAAFEFSDISNQNLDYIAKTCIQKQIEDRRNNLY